ncbi:chorismate mutase [Streptomyces sp. NRRL S-1521]|uniref:chorismate mutase n=1 Tax=Streptomyces sp. NRRL S-1521 TaxID=1609100 RepID=UPI00074A0AAF|nr:chorismate mutase [Streptomyces sp. NRRL S-1521]KUL58582.1 chorismate mutase [Streptomyces sp. NRRL S-1521]
MRPASPAGRLLAAGVLAAALLTGAGPAAEASAAAARPSGAHERLRPLAGLSAQRLATADLVAAAKYGAGGPIDDPAREKVVLDTVARQAREAGADPAATVRIFRDQIEASKLVQRELFRRWDADPGQAPDERPDLAEVREEINRINGELVRGIAASERARTSPRCGGALTVAAVRVRHDARLDALHSVGLGRALRSVCPG